MNRIFHGKFRLFLDFFWHDLKTCMHIFSFKRKKPLFDCSAHPPSCECVCVFAYEIGEQLVSLSSFVGKQNRRQKETKTSRATPK